MSSCILFHGPGARQAALTKARSMGELVAPPFGDEGLKVKEAREAISALLQGSISFLVQVVVIGPVDEATPQASDVLLKNIEEFREGIVQPILWAHDVGGVKATIRSRSLEYWAPKKEADADDEAMLGAAWEIVNLVKTREVGPIPELVKPFSKELPGLLCALSLVLAQDMEDIVNQKLWEALRPVTRHLHPRKAEVVSALVGVVHG